MAKTIALLRKNLSILLALALMLCALPAFYAGAAGTEPVVAAAQVTPEGGATQVNEVVTFTVTANTATTRVKITYPDGSIYVGVDIDKGFTFYTDSGNTRTFSIPERVEILGITGLTAYAGNSDYGYSAQGVEVAGLESQQSIDVLSITLAPTAVTLTEGGTKTITATVAPNNASNKLVSWSSSDSSVATVVNGVVTAVAEGTATITARSVSNTNIYATATVTVTASGSGTHTEPPYPFWQDYVNYSTPNTYVYYYGKIYYNAWYVAAGVKPGEDDAWKLVGDAEWTVEEDPANYTKSETETDEYINRTLTPAEVETLWGGINEDYSPEAALGRLEELIPQSYYEELFPYRFGSAAWKACPATKDHYPNPNLYDDYYSYANLQEAIETLANTMIKVEWYDGASWCYRLIRLDKTTLEQYLVYSDDQFNEDYLVTGHEKISVVCDYGSFLAVGSLNDRKRELAGFLANISHETGGGSVDGTLDELYTGLYFNEEVGLIGTTSPHYVQETGTAYLPVAGKSYHGRGPIQLSYNYNYGLCSDVLYGDSSVLLANPERVCEDGVVGFMTGIWFWMTPQPPKPSCHQVITGIWNPKAGAVNAEYNGNFGLTIVIINNESGQSENGAGAVPRRARYYRAFSAKMGADITGEQCDTVGMTAFSV
ncbi:MAG: Ig-like domain-containing protein [Clostridia bacterium]|nr:Ig-like domain-containing protein [Clostridia bacterium]